MILNNKVYYLAKVLLITFLLIFLSRNVHAQENEDLKDIISKIDIIQIKRWKNFNRHVMAIKKNCESVDLNCRKRQRQAILQWAYNPFI